MAKRTRPLIVNTRKKFACKTVSEALAVCRKLRRWHPAFRFSRIPVGIPLSKGEEVRPARAYEIEVYDAGTGDMLGRLSSYMRVYL